MKKIRFTVLFGISLFCSSCSSAFSNDLQTDSNQESIQEQSDHSGFLQTEDIASFHRTFADVIRSNIEITHTVPDTAATSTGMIPLAAYQYIYDSPHFDQQLLLSNQDVFDPSMMSLDAYQKYFNPDPSGILQSSADSDMMSLDEYKDYYCNDSTGHSQIPSGSDMMSLVEYKDHYSQIPSE